MTEKYSPRALITCDFQLTGDEIKRLETAAKIQFTKSQSRELSDAFGRYMAGTIISSHSCSPKEIKATLEIIKKPLKSLLDSFNKFWGIDGASSLLVDNVGILPPDLELVSEDLKMLGLAPSRPSVEEIRKNDPYLVVGHLIDQQLSQSPETEDPFDIAYLHEVLRITLSSVEAIENDIKSTGGRPGDPYFTSFLIDLLNVICCDFTRGHYESRTINFIDESRLIVADRLEAKGMKKEKQIVMHLSKNLLIDRIRDAIKEDTDTGGRARFRDK